MKNEMQQKKAQVTIFMIVGLIIIIAGAVFFYSAQKAKKPLEPEVSIIQEQLPTEFDSLRKYVNDCVYSTAVEGLNTIGKQGGYASFSDRNINYEQFTITAKPTESDAVSFAHDSDLKTAYWWYLKSANNCKSNCQFASKRPELRNTENSIEKQLERRIDSKLKGCVGNFESFVEQGYKITESTLKTDVTITLNDVVVLVEYPITAEKQDAKAELKQFIVNVPVNLERIYDLAARITNLEIKHHFLEKHAMNLIAAFSGVDKDKLPPMSDLQFKFGSKVSWYKTDIKNKITAMLTSYIPLFQVDGTYNYERNLFGSELKQRLYDSTIIPVDTPFDNLAAYFTYLDLWPAYFDLNCDGEQCKPSSANSLIQFFGIQDYRFAYDLSFPVLVEIKDPFALNGKGYILNFFLEGNIRNNKPMPADFSQLEAISESEKSLLCDARTSSDVTIEIKDDVAKKPIDDAQVLYTNIDESCFIGSTDENGALKEKFPVGIGGVVNVLKEGYISKATEFDPQLDVESSLNVNLQPIYTKNIVVRKKNFVKSEQGWEFNSAPIDLTNKESATVTLTRVNDEGEIDFVAVAGYEGQQNEQSQIEIAAGNYEADISLILNERIVIPEREECEKIKILGVTVAKECYKVPKIDFGERAAQGEERFPAGGLKLNFEIKPEDIANNNNIVLYVVNIGIAGIPEEKRVVEDIEQLGKIEEYSTAYQYALQPTFEQK